MSNPYPSEAFERAVRAILPLLIDELGMPFSAEDYGKVPVAHVIVKTVTDAMRGQSAFAFFVEASDQMGKSEPVAIYSTQFGANVAKGLERRRRSYIKELPLDPSPSQIGVAK